MSELILIVDDEPGILSTLGGILSDEGYSTLTTTSGESALTLYEEKRPAVVFLDIWLADRDGLETLQALREADPTAAVVMMSGHGTTSTAVKAIKMGAYDYLEKPLSYKRAVDAAAGALEYKRTLQAGAAQAVPERRRDRGEAERRFAAVPDLPLLAETGRNQRTLRHSTVVYGLGLHSGQRTGMVLQPLPENSGIHFVTLPTGVEIPAHVSAVAETDYATTLSGDGAGEGETIRTVEHLLSALHAYGVGNLLIKVHGEIPVLDGSALEFCKVLEEIGVAEQPEPQREVVIDRRYEVNGSGEK
ncbi:MAG TPA: UDP-3-O-acyl-N-acetylglucosamine deacetylase, partial [Thermoanaerobaculia bacterium]